MEDNNIVNEKKLNEKNKILYLLIGVVIIILIISGTTYAYYTFNATNDSNITGTAGDVNLSLTVNKVLPSTSGVDDILITNFNELAPSLNDGCIDSEGEFALCQLYKINLANNSTGVNVTVSGSVSFNNATAPNLSWIYIDGYSASTSYTADSLGSSFNTASSTFTNFVENRLINSGTNSDFYLLVWVNESEDEQTDEGSYSGTIRFMDANGKGVTSTFNN